MTTSGIASTALDFLGTIDPDDSVWDEDGIEGFVQQFQSLATKKRHAREQSRINRAIETLRAEIESLPDGEFEIDLGAFVSADVPAVDAAAVLSRIEDLITAIVAHRHDAERFSSVPPHAISERALVYQAMGASLSQIMERRASLVELVPSAFQAPIPAVVESLSQHIIAAASKRISEGEISKHSSNQHEFNGARELLQLLGETTETKRFPTRFVYLSDVLDHVTTADALLSWYDARARGRARGENRTEYRLYYSGTTVLDLAVAGDLLVIAKLFNDKLLAIIAKKESISYDKLLWLIGLLTPVGNLFQMRFEDQFQEASSDSDARQVLRAIRIAIESPVTGRLEVV